MILVALGGGLIIVATFLPWISAMKSAVEGDPKGAAVLQCAQQLGIPPTALFSSGQLSPQQQIALEQCVGARAARGFPKDLYRVRKYSGWQLEQRCSEHDGAAICSVAVEENTQGVPTGVWTLAIGTGLLAVAALLAIATRSSRTWARRTLLGVSVIAVVLAVLFALALWAYASPLHEWPKTHAPYASRGFGQVRAGIGLVVVGSAVALSGAVVASWRRRRPLEQA